MYKVLKDFRDKTNNEQIVKVGESYQHEDAERIAFLIKEGFLEKKESSSRFPKHTGGGWYELSNGEKVQGKEEATVAEEKLGE